MAPTCSPKKLAAETGGASTDDFEFITPPPLSNRHAEDRLIAKLKQQVPDVDKYFDVLEQIGQGTFSSVFSATLRGAADTDAKRFALKQLIPTCHPDRIVLELKCMQDMGGKDNVVGIDLCLRSTDNVVFVMPYQRHEPFAQYVGLMTGDEVALYMKNLLIALARVHSFDVIHRDVKPSNFLYDRDNRTFKLVDFGLAQNVSPCAPPPAPLPSVAKRKRERSPDDAVDPEPKRSALQRRSGNVANVPCGAKSTVRPAAQKENDPHCRTKTTPPPLRSPFKSPLKANTSVNVQMPRKSPFKFTGLDLPPNHSTVQKSAGKRRLFQDDEDSSVATIKPSTPKVTPHRGGGGLVFATSQRRAVYLNNKSSTPNTTATKASPSGDNSPFRCNCYGKPSVCSVCITRKGVHAPRAGTPGFRPPEVLLKCTHQTTAVDMWAAGVVMLCVLSGCYPFFRGTDDVGSLAELVTLFGDRPIKRLAHRLGRLFMCSERKQPLDLRKVCCRLRFKTAGGAATERTVDKCFNCMQPKDDCLCPNVTLKGVPDLFPATAYDLLTRLLDIDPDTRITAAQALQHPFVRDV